MTYVVAAFLAGPDWGAVARLHGDAALDSRAGLRVAFGGDHRYHYRAVDDLLAQNNVVDKNADESDIVLQRIDTTTGSVIACAIAWFIIITTGAVLYPAGIQVADAADAALALEPIAGEFATVLFAAGLVAASFLPRACCRA